MQNLKEQLAHLEKQLENAPEMDDPMQAISEYAELLRSAPKHQAEDGRYSKFLEKATREYRKDTRYTQDIRYLRLWIYFTRVILEPQAVFEYLMVNGIGSSLALFYEEAAKFYESDGRCDKAREIFLKGLSVGAMPTERLQKRFNEFQQRLTNKENIETKPETHTVKNETVKEVAKVTVDKKEHALAKNERAWYTVCLVEDGHEVSFEEVRARSYFATLAAAVKKVPSLASQPLKPKQVVADIMDMFDEPLESVADHDKTCVKVEPSEFDFFGPGPINSPISDDLSDKDEIERTCTIVQNLPVQRLNFEKLEVYRDEDDLTIHQRMARNAKSSKSAGVLSRKPLAPKFVRHEDTEESQAATEVTIMKSPLDPDDDSPLTSKALASKKDLRPTFESQLEKEPESEATLFPYQAYAGNKHLSPITEASIEDSRYHSTTTSATNSTFSFANRTHNEATMPCLPEIDFNQENGLLADLKELEISRAVAKQSTSNKVIEWLDQDVVDELLNGLDPPLKDYAYFNYFPTETTHMPPKRESELPFLLRLGKETYELRQLLGEGSSGTVYSAGFHGEEDTQFAVKYETPASPWEFYCLSQLHCRLNKQFPDLSRLSFITPYACGVYKNVSVLVLQENFQHNLLDAINVSFADLTLTGGMDELLVMFYAIEILRTVEQIHSVNITHSDLKPEHFLLRFRFLFSESEIYGEWNGGGYDKDGMNGWASKGVCLLDFGRAVDFRLTESAHVIPWSSNNSKSHSNVSILDDRIRHPWTKDVDHVGAASVLFALIFGKPWTLPLKQMDACDKWTPAAWMLDLQRQHWKRSYLKKFWLLMFSYLLGMDVAELGGEDLEFMQKEGIAWSLAGFKTWLVAYLTENCEKNGKSLASMLKKLERLLAMQKKK